jgi:hypothetical protein
VGLLQDEAGVWAPDDCQALLVDLYSSYTALRSFRTVPGIQTGKTTSFSASKLVSVADDAADQPIGRGSLGGSGRNQSALRIWRG